MLEEEISTETVEAPVGRADGEGPDLEDPALYFNRELSWLDFNERVLELAEQSSVPLLERVKFCAIYASNLDEFFMVRVAGLFDQVDAGIDARGPDGLSPGEQIDAIQERVLELDARLNRCFNGTLRPALEEEGIRIVPLSSASEAERAEIDQHFHEQVFPALTPLVIGLGRPFPYISNLSLSLGVLLRDPDGGHEIIARVKVPKELLGRFLRVGEDGNRFVALEDVIAANLDSLFPGTEVIDHGYFRVTRDADFTISDEADDLLQAVQDEIRARRFGEVVRLEIAAGMNPTLRQQLIDALKLEAREVYEIEGLIDLADLWDIAAVPGYSELRFEPWSPVTQPRLQADEDEAVDMFSAIRKGDLLVHHPYDSFSTSVERFVEQAVADPDVLAIKQTVYRTSDDSPLVPDLIRASERGKQAVCMVELKARFDEEANIQWAKSLEEAGVHVVYGIPGLKTHVKAILVARREGDRVRHYVHVGTGNYHPKTARLYTDLGLFTADPEIGCRRRRDVQFPYRVRPPSGIPEGPGLTDDDADDDHRGDLEDGRGASRRKARPDRAEDELAGRRRLHPGALPCLRGRGADRAQRARDLLSAARGAGRLRDDPGYLDRRPLPRAFAHLRLRARRGDPRSSPAPPT